ncbi:hypothetical protein ACFX2G_005092 [Malus domestica]
MGNLYSALDNEHPIPLATLVFIDPTNTKKFFSLSEQPLAPEAWNFFLSLLPSHQGPVKSQEYEPIVWDALPPSSVSRGHTSRIHL